MTNSHFIHSAPKHTSGRGDFKPSATAAFLVRDEDETRLETFDLYATRAITIAIPWRSDKNKSIAVHSFRFEMAPASTSIMLHAEPRGVGHTKYYRIETAVTNATTDWIPFYSLHSRDPDPAGNNLIAPGLLMTEVHPDGRPDRFDSLFISVNFI